MISLRLWVGNAQGPSTTITIDAAAHRHPINPNIYGVAFATTAQLTDLNTPLNRSGGNANIMDNEPSLWSWIHSNAHPTGPTMDEIKDKMIDYGAKVKAADPSALVVGPEEWGWNGYFYSGYDQQWGGLHGWSNLPDRANHGGKDYLPWVLDQLHQHDVQSGQRSLDVFTVHWYPQGGEAFSDDVSTSMSSRIHRGTHIR